MKLSEGSEFRCPRSHILIHNLFHGFCSQYGNYIILYTVSCQQISPFTSQFYFRSELFILLAKFAIYEENSHFTSQIFTNFSVCVKVVPKFPRMRANFSFCELNFQFSGWNFHLTKPFSLCLQVFHFAIKIWFAKLLVLRALKYFTFWNIIY